MGFWSSVANAATGGLAGNISGAIHGYQSGGIGGAIAGGTLGGTLVGQFGGGGQGGQDMGFNAPKFNEATDAPQISTLRNYINGMQGPQQVSAPQGFTPDNSTYKGSVYQAKDYSGPLAEFNTLRQQTNQQANQQKSANQDAIARRFAAMGNLNSGSYAKSAQNADLQSDQQREQSLNNIGFQEAQQRRNLEQQEQNKVFQSQEANTGREFAFGQNQASRNFQGEQAAQQRGLQANEFNAGQSNDFQKFKEQSQTQLAQLDQQAQQFQKQLAEDQYQAQVNRYTQQHSGGLLGSGGFLGTGIGI